MYYYTTGAIPAAPFTSPVRTHLSPGLSLPACFLPDIPVDSAIIYNRARVSSIKFSKMIGPLASDWLWKEIDLWYLLERRGKYALYEISSLDL